MKLDISYIAGFVDGEGCISIYGLKDVRLSIVNTNLEILKDIQEYFGYGQIRKKSRTPKDKVRKVAYTYEVWGRQTQKILEQLLPYLRQKQRQAQVALEFCDLIRPPGAQRGAFGTTGLSDKEKEERLKLQTRIKELKWCA